MGISLAPELDTANTTADPTKKPPVAKPVTTAAPTLAPAPSIGLAPAPQAPGKAGGVPAMTAPAPMTAPGIPAPTVAAPSAPVDRIKLATDTFNQSAASTQGAYDAASRDNIHNSAALGQVASGGLRTREGDLQLARGRDLDLLRQKLVTNATEGSIADATTAYQQGLAGSQQGLAEKIGLAGIDAQKGSLDLEKEKFATGADQSQQQIDLAKKQNEQQYGLEGEKLGLAKEGQAASIEQSKAALALQEKLGLGGLSADQQRIAIAQKQQELDTAFNAGKMSLAERDAARADLAQAQQNTLATGQLDLAKTAQEQNNANDQQRIQLAKDQLAQTGEQFGLSLAQQHELATLADKTQNRQLDISTAQGKNSLLLELARIMGGKDMVVDKDFLAAIARSLGMVGSDKDVPPPPPPPPAGGVEVRGGSNGGGGNPYTGKTVSTV